MGYTAKDYQRLIEKYIDSSEGRKFLMSKKIPTPSYVYARGEQIARDLKKDLIEGFLAIVNEPGATFNENAVSIIPRYEKTYGTNSYTIRILFTDEALQRPRLTRLREDQEPSGKIGVYDIFGLFTNGYVASNYAYGFWNEIDSTQALAEKSGPIRSRRVLMGNDFINHIMHSYQITYPDVIFQWPKEWGGNT